MTKSEISLLQNIIMGYTYSENLINKAIKFADSLEVSVCLKALRGGRNSFQSRMLLQDFVCRLSVA